MDGNTRDHVGPRTCERHSHRKARERNNPSGRAGTMGAHYEKCTPSFSSQRPQNSTQNCPQGTSKKFSPPFKGCVKTHGKEKNSKVNTKDSIPCAYGHIAFSMRSNRRLLP